MIYGIDWLSFSVKLDPKEGANEIECWYDVQQALIDLLPETIGVLHITDRWTWVNGRAPYRVGKMRNDHGVTIFMNPTLPHALIELTGRACTLLSEDARAYSFLEDILPRLTRIDIAADMLTDLDPREFVKERDAGRFRSTAEVVSASGTTCYVGSKTSSRYARVYRYNPPHERSKFLRCEFSLKAEDAKLTAAGVLEHGVSPVTKTLGEKFGWRHPAWQPEDVTEIELRAWRPERREGKTLFWLADTVAPLLVRLHSEGTIDAEQWFRENVARIIKGELNDE